MGRRIHSSAIANSSENPNVIHCSTWSEIPGEMVKGDCVTDPEEYCKAPAVSLVASEAVKTSATERNSTAQVARLRRAARRGFSGNGLPRLRRRRTRRTSETRNRKAAPARMEMKIWDCSTKAVEMSALASLLAAVVAFAPVVFEPGTWKRLAKTLSAEAPEVRWHENSLSLLRAQIPK